MSGEYSNEPMLDIYIFETSQNIERLEQCILSSEKSDSYTVEAINEIFRIMHTIKGSSAMMLFDNITTLAHSMEDLFFLLREKKSRHIDCSALSGIILESIDFIKVELEKIKQGDRADGDSETLADNIRTFLEMLKCDLSPAGGRSEADLPEKHQYYIQKENPPFSLTNNAFKAVVFFEDNCEMENIRAYTIIHNLREFADDIYFLPEDIIENEDSIGIIKEQGFTVYVRTDKSYDEMYDFFMQTIFLKELKLTQYLDEQECGGFGEKRPSLQDVPLKVPKIQEQAKEFYSSQAQSIISVNVSKLDILMDLVGEMVIAEAMVTQNPDLHGLELNNFHKAARQLHKITSELQDMVMSIRMVPISSTFHKMHRIVRDMSKKLEKEVKLEIIGEETEVDKNIIENISDPLMHLVRNAVDHGIEVPSERILKNKPKAGTITLEAKNAGSDVNVMIRDDGKGLNKEKILARAKANDLLLKPESEMTDKEIYNLIFLPGFSTKDDVTEFSGRGVGMDVVLKGLESVGGSVQVDSSEGTGTTVTLKIPLTLAIIDGMNIRVGSSVFTIPTISIKESFRPMKNDLVTDPDGNEMIMVRGRIYPILRLHKIYGVKTDITDFTEGILIMVEQEGKSFCLFADGLMGQQQVVVKALPQYIKSTRKIHGLAGCTLLGDGSISLILDINGLLQLN